MVLFIAASVISLLAVITNASPYPFSDLSLRLRTDSDEPQFPASPASCGLCQQNYDSIKLCISVVPIMVNFTTVIENPGSFVNVISCACGDQFKTTFPQCIDCFEQTDQESFLNMPDPDAVIEGTNKVCALENAVFGSGSTSSIEPVGGFTDTQSSTTATSTPTSDSTSSASTPTTSSGALRNLGSFSGLFLAVLLGSACW
jgi:hypothetical protein